MAANSANVISANALNYANYYNIDVLISKAYKDIHLIAERNNNQLTKALLQFAVADNMCLSPMICLMINNGRYGEAAANYAKHLSTKMLMEFYQNNKNIYFEKYISEINLIHKKEELKALIHVINQLTVQFDIKD